MNCIYVALFCAFSTFIYIGIITNNIAREDFNMEMETEGGVQKSVIFWW